MTRETQTAKANTTAVGAVHNPSTIRDAGPVKTTITSTTLDTGRHSGIQGYVSNPRPLSAREQRRAEEKKHGKKVKAKQATAVTTKTWWETISDWVSSPAAKTPEEKRLEKVRQNIALKQQQASYQRLDNLLSKYERNPQNYQDIAATVADVLKDHLEQWERLDEKWLRRLSATLSAEQLSEVTTILKGEERFFDMDEMEEEATLEKSEKALAEDEEFVEVEEYEEERTAKEKRDIETEKLKRDLVLGESVLYQNAYSRKSIAFASGVEMQVIVYQNTSMASGNLSLALVFSDKPASVQPIDTGMSFSSLDNLKVTKVGNNYLVAYGTRAAIKLCAVKPDRSITPSKVIYSGTGPYDLEISSFSSQNNTVISFVDFVNLTQFGNLNTSAYAYAVDQNTIELTPTPFSPYTNLYTPWKALITANDEVVFFFNNGANTVIRWYQFNPSNSQFTQTKSYTLSENFIDITINSQGQIAYIPLTAPYTNFVLHDMSTGTELLRDRFTLSTASDLNPYKIYTVGNDLIPMAYSSTLPEYGGYNFRGRIWSGKIYRSSSTASPQAMASLVKPFQITRPSQNLLTITEIKQISDGVAEIDYDGYQSPLVYTPEAFSMTMATKIQAPAALIQAAAVQCTESTACDISTLTTPQAPYNPVTTTADVKVSGVGANPAYAAVACTAKLANVTVSQVSPQEVQVTDSRPVKDASQIVSCQVQPQPFQNVANSGSMQITFTFNDGGFSPQQTLTLPLVINPVPQTTAVRNPQAPLPASTTAQYGAVWSIQIPQNFCLGINNFTAANQSKMVELLNNGVVAPITINVFPAVNGSHTVSTASRVNQSIQATDVDVISQFPPVNGSQASCSQSMRLTIKPSFVFDQMNNLITCSVSQSVCTLGSAAPHLDPTQSVTDLNYTVTATLNDTSVAEFVTQVNSLFQVSADKQQLQFSDSFFGANQDVQLISLFFKLMQSANLNLTINNGYASQTIAITVTPNGNVIVNGGLGPDIPSVVGIIAGLPVLAYILAVIGVTIRDVHTLSAIKDPALAEFLRTLGVYLSEDNIKRANTALTKIRAEYTARDEGKERQIQAAPAAFGKEAATALESLQKLGSYYENHKGRSLLFFSRHRDLKDVTDADAKNIAAAIDSSTSSSEETSSSRHSQPETTVAPLNQVVVMESPGTAESAPTAGVGFNPFA